MVLAVIGVVIGLMLLVAWLVDRHDRKLGRGVKDAKVLREQIRAARRERRAKIVGTNPLVSRALRRPDDAQRPIKRGQ